MVLIHVKKGDRSQFLHEAPFEQQIDEILRDIVQINNTKVKIEILITNIKGLLEHGPLRPEAVRGLTSSDTYTPAYETLSQHEKDFLSISLPGHTLVTDQTGYRTGLIASKNNSEKLIEVIEQAKNKVSNENADKKVVLLQKDLQEILMLLKGGIMIVYPGYYGLPEWDPVFQILEDKMVLLAHYPDCEWIEEKKSTLWWAKRELVSLQPLSNFVGKNNKTKIIAKLMEKGKGAPLSEPAIDKETHNKMLSFYHKKQEEMKKLEEDNEDFYLDSTWANSQNLKNQLLNGGKEVRYKTGLMK